MTNTQIASSDLEREFLGMLIFSNGNAVPAIADFLSPNDFFIPAFKDIFSSVLNIYRHGFTLNIQTLIFDLKASFPDNPDLLKIAFDIKNSAFSDAYVIPYAKKIKERSLRSNFAIFANDWLSKANNLDEDFDSLIFNAQKALQSFELDVTPNSILDQCHYLNQSFLADIESNKIYSQRRTGFYNIDEHQIFAPGLYVIGATPACGKTTFAWQLLNQLAKNGEYCIFCSYEMSKLELFSKTFSRELFIRDEKQAITSADIRKGVRNDLFEEILLESCKPDFPRVNLFELQDESVDDLLRLLKPYVNNSNGKSPVVCLDYLQIVPSNDKKLLSDKAKIDDIVRKLKTFQRETNTTFIVISSFNRMNYYQQVTFESFKESGNIEYTADVIWALQLNVVNHIKFGDSVSDTRKKFEDAKKQKPREIQLKCLKNRNGMNYDAYFQYFSAHDFFKPCDHFDDTEQDEKSSNNNDNKNFNSEGEMEG